MRRSALFCPVRREGRTDDFSNNSYYLERMGFIHPLAAGLYTHLPLGFKLFNNVKNVLRRNLHRIVPHSEHEFPALHPRKLWEDSGRLSVFGNSIFCLEDQHGRPHVMAPTHEATAAATARAFITSYKDMPIRISQIQIKYRDEPRPRGGVIRTRQFTMHDLYSFDVDFDAAKIGYDLVKTAYIDTFRDLRLPIHVQAQEDMGAIGGDLSHEYHLETEVGEDQFLRPDGQQVKSLELAHIFMLGTGYSESLDAYFVTPDDRKLPVYMCSFGMGIERTAAAYIERYMKRGDRDAELSWSWQLAPFQIMVIGELNRSLDAYTTLVSAGYDVLIDDRDIRMSVALREGLMFGFPMYVIAGQKTSRGTLEFVCRRAGIRKEIDEGDLLVEVESAKKRLTAVELAEMTGQVIEVDDYEKQIYVRFPDVHALDAVYYDRYEIGQDLIGNFGPTRRPKGQVVRLKFGEYWVRPVVSSSQGGIHAAIHNGISYLAADNSSAATASDIRAAFERTFA
jgi:prolyl-tRNA synthetase